MMSIRCLRSVASLTTARSLRSRTSTRLATSRAETLRVGCARPTRDRTPRNRVAARTFNFLQVPKRRRKMDREHVKGAADKAKGAIKDAAGKVTGDEKLQA